MYSQRVVDVEKRESLSLSAVVVCTPFAGEIIDPAYISFPSFACLFLCFSFFFLSEMRSAHACTRTQTETSPATGSPLLSPRQRRKGAFQHGQTHCKGQGRRTHYGTLVRLAGGILFISTCAHFFVGLLSSFVLFPFFLLFHFVRACH